MKPNQPTSRVDRRWYALLLLPVIALLSPVYLRSEPSIAGIPFFYAYQMLLIPVSAGITWIVYLATRNEQA